MNIVNFFTLNLSGISSDTRNIVVREAITTETRPAVRTTDSNMAKRIFMDAWFLKEWDTVYSDLQLHE